MQHLIFEKKFSQALHELISKFSYRVAAGVADGVVVAVPSRDTQDIYKSEKAPTALYPFFISPIAHTHACTPTRILTHTGLC